MVMFGVGKGQWLEGAAGWGWGSLGLCSKMSFPSLWKECMQYTDRLEEAHCFVCGSVFVSVVEDVFCICRLWVIVLYVTCVFLVSHSERPASLTYIRMFAGVAC